MPSSTIWGQHQPRYYYETFDNVEGGVFYLACDDINIIDDNKYYLLYRQVGALSVYAAGV